MLIRLSPPGAPSRFSRCPLLSLFILMFIPGWFLYPFDMFPPFSFLAQNDVLASSCPFLASPQEPFLPGALDPVHGEWYLETVDARCAPCY